MAGRTYAFLATLTATALACLPATATFADGKNDSEPKKIAYTSLCFGDSPLVLTTGQGERKIGAVQITGTLGGRGRLSLGTTAGKFESAFGGGSLDFTADLYDLEVELKELPVQDPAARKRKLYEIAGSPIKDVSLRLVVPTRPGDAPRFLVVGGKDGQTVLRAITLETLQEP